MVIDRKELIYLIICVLACLFIVISNPPLIPLLPFLLTQIFAVLLIFWSLLAIRMNTHETHIKTLGKSYFLVKKGPYEIIRHPIYGGLLLLMFSFLQMDLNLWRLFAFVLLLCTVLLKMTYEENVMQDAVKEYPHYKNVTHRIIPYIY